MDSSIRSNLSPGIWGSNSLLQLKALLPKREADLSRLKEDQKKELKEKISQILTQDFASLYQVNESSNLRKIYTKAVKAEKMGLLSEPIKILLPYIATVVAQKAPQDLKLETKNGTLLVNSDLFMKRSKVVKRMLQSSFKEVREKTVDWTRYSKETVNFLVVNLLAPSALPFLLPADNNFVFELIDLAKRHDFREFNSKLGPAVTNFIDQHPEIVLENIEAWMNLLVPLAKGEEEDPHALKWLADMTPHLLKAMDIPFTPSTIPGKFEIPIAQSNAFFNEKTRGFLQVLPVLLEIKGKEDVQHFQRSCQTEMVEGPLSITVLPKTSLTERDRAIISDIEKKCSIKVSVEKLPIPADATIFGQEQWETHFGPIGEAPPLPVNIVEILNSPCPFNPGKMVKDTHMLVLIPKTVSGNPLNMIHLKKLVENPKGGHKTTYESVYQPILTEHGTKPAEGSYWVLMTKDVIPESRAKSYAQQQALVGAKPGYEVPDLLSAIVGMLTHYVHTGTCLFSREPWTYTRCKEQVGGLQTVVGGLSPGGLSIHRLPQLRLRYDSGLPACGSSFRSLVLGSLVLEKGPWFIGYWSLVSRRL